MPFWYFFPVPQIPADVAHESNQLELVEYLAKEGSAVDMGTPLPSWKTGGRFSS